MNREDILRMAREADAHADKKLSPGEFHPDWHDVRDLHFAALVAAAERDSVIEQCERLKWKSRKSEYLKGMDAAYENVIKWLRARGEK